MPPRYQSTLLTFEEKARNLFDHFGQPAHRGHGRGPGGASGAAFGTAQSLIRNPGERADPGDSAHLLVMSATAASIASGGDYVTFDALVAQHGFGSVLTQPGEGWTHPVSGVYALTYSDRWTGYDGAAAAQLELDGTLIPEGQLIDDAIEGDVGMGAILYVAEAGQVGRIKVTQSSGSAQTCDALVRVGITDPKTALTALDASNVVALGTQADPDVTSWTAGGSAWVDPAAEWIWHTALDGGGERPDNEEAWFEGRYDSVSAVAVTVEFSPDNTCEVWLNGVSLGTGADFTARYTAAATLKAGANLFEVYAQNGVATTNPAGFILSVHDASETVLFRTNDETGWTGYTTAPPGWSH